MKEHIRKGIEAYEDYHFGCSRFYWDEFNIVFDESKFRINSSR